MPQPRPVRRPVHALDVDQLAVARPVVLGTVGGSAAIAYQVDDERVLCAPGCLSHAEAQALVDAGRRVGDVQPWTVDLWSGEPDLTCAGCGRVLVQAPPDIDENELAEEQ